MGENENIIDFNLPKNQSSVIKVIGIGGGGGNAINYMYENGIKGVDFLYVIQIHKRLKLVQYQ